MAEAFANVCSPFPVTTPGVSSSTSSVPAPVQAADSTYSVVIPVYNSEKVVGDTVDRTLADMKRFREEVAARL